MVPARLPDPGVTIVVVPFRALLNDLSDRLGKQRSITLNGEVAK